MNLFKYVFILLMIISKCFSQKEIVLKTVSFDNQNLPIYIDQVIDNRQDKSVFILNNNNKINVNLKPSLSKAIKKFINTSFSNSIKTTPIFVEIKEFKIQKFQSDIDELTARVYINLVFSEKNAENLKKITEIKHHEEEQFKLENDKDIFETHEKRIRATLEYCMQKFMYQYKKNKDILSNNSNIVNYHKSDIYTPSIKNGQWYNLLTYKRVFSKHKKGWNIAYTGFSDSNNDFIIPFVISYDQFSSKIKNHKKYKSIDSYTIGTGFDGYLKLHQGVYANLGINIPVGIESIKYITNKRKNNFLIGINLKQGIKIIPWKNYGIVIGANVFQQLQNSKNYTTDIGFEIEVGFNI